MTLKLRRYDFTTITRSQTLPQPTDDDRRIAATARRLLTEAGTSGGLRLLGVGVSGLSRYAQGDLFGEGMFDADPAEPHADPAEPHDEERFAAEDEPTDDATPVRTPHPPPAAPPDSRWWPGQDVRHDEHGAGWVWGRGLGRVTLRFEGPATAPGPVRTLAADDPALHPGDPPDWRKDPPGLHHSPARGGPLQEGR